MAVMRQSWTDERLDEFGKRMDERFDHVDRRSEDVDRRFGEVNQRLDRIDARLGCELPRIHDRIDSLGRAIIFGSITLSSAMIAGFVAIATQV
ncbi:MAG: hypothetical protein JJE35_04505 [Thermoleophilia bacterium]|nr:hypothetical protein [Thermoleophilia bacterium]